MLALSGLQIAVRRNLPVDDQRVPIELDFHRNFRSESSLGKFALGANSLKGLSFSLSLSSEVARALDRMRAGSSEENFAFSSLPHRRIIAPTNVPNRNSKLSDFTNLQSTI